jgi:hypothetical protein
MKMLRGSFAAIGTAVLLTIALACSEQPTPAAEVPQATPTINVIPTPTVVKIDPTTPPPPAYGYESLLKDLRSQGVEAEEVTGPQTQYSFSVGGDRVTARTKNAEGTIHVFEFPDTDITDTEASHVSSDGWMISVPLEGEVVKETIHEWMQTPHFYKKGALIVVHIGDDEAVLAALATTLGPQFAGGQTPAVPATKTPPPSPTPLVTREWKVEDIQVDGSTVTVMLRVYAGIDVRVTLNGAPADEIKPTVPVLQYVFLNVIPGQHTVEVRDVVGFEESKNVTVVLPNKIPNAIPDWLAELIRKLQAEPVTNPPISVTQYEYAGKTVYFIPQRCCDIFSDLYDSDGSIIGHPDGGITGRGDGRVPDFHQERSGGRLIWQDERTQEPSQVQTKAPIESVEATIMEIIPPQYSLVVKTGLPNACVTFGGHRIDRSGETIRIELINWKPSDAQMMCDQVYRTVETRIALGSDFESGKKYTFEVNDVVETLIIQ